MAIIIGEVKNFAIGKNDKTLFLKTEDEKDLIINVTPETQIKELCYNDLRKYKKVVVCVSGKKFKTFPEQINAESITVRKFEEAKK